MGATVQQGIGSGRQAASTAGTSLAELISYYMVRERTLDAVATNRRRLLAFTTVSIIGLMGAPLRLSTSSARIIGSIALALFGILLLFSLMVARRGLRQTRAMLELVDQIFECDEHLRQHADDPDRRATEKYFEGRFRSVDPILRRLAEDDGLLPITLPLTPQAAVTARVAGDSGHSMGKMASVVLPAIAIYSFIMIWTSAFMLTWASSPDTCTLGLPSCNGAFQGLPSDPALSDFVYLTLNAIAANMPPDIVARSRLAHAIFAGTFISGILIVALFLVPAVSNLREQISRTRARANA